MQNSIWCWLSICFILITSTVAVSVQGDNFCSDLMCVTAIVNSSTVLYELTALNQLGWMAVGFGSNMTNSKMVILWQNSDGSVTLSQRTATGLVEPLPDPDPPRIATLDNSSTVVSSSLNRLSFTVPNDNTINQTAVWAYSFVNPDSALADVELAMHIEAATFFLLLNNTVDPDAIPALQPSSSSTSTAGTSTSTGVGGDTNNGSLNLTTPDKLVYAHSVVSVLGFLVILPLGALFARWARTLNNNWFFYHWANQALLGVPVIVVGWVLGVMAVSASNRAHFDDLHKVLGLLLLLLYICQLCTGVLVHIYKSTSYPKRHPPQSYAHAIFGLLIIGLAFTETRNGYSVEWTFARLGTINNRILSVLWIVWIVVLAVAYFSGFILIRRQLARERELPPPYTPGNGMGSCFGLFIGHMRQRETLDDGTHDIFSEAAADSLSSSTETGAQTESTTASSRAIEIEMREAGLDGVMPISVRSSPMRTYLSFSALSPVQ